MSPTQAPTQVPAQILRTTFLGELRTEVAGSDLFGETPMGQMRRIDYFENSHFKGPKVDVQILKGSADALLRRFDGVVQPDVRLTLETADGHFRFIRHRGYRQTAPEVMKRIAREEAVSPEEVYLRTALFFETDSESHAWLSNTVAIGVGRREPKAAVYDVYEVL